VCDALKDIRGRRQNPVGMIVIGIDPGAANTDFGVIRTVGERMAALDGGVIETPGAMPLERRLGALHDALSQLVDWHQPEAMALEDLYFGRNVASALSVGQARGVALLAASQGGVPCFDYTPQAVKKAVCGSGSADKGQVQRMVASLLGLPEPPTPDHAADAFAVAICHAGVAATRLRPHLATPADRPRVSGFALRS
jgi:crossover junction endodeoxyribonuclease RuvC